MKYCKGCLEADTRPNSKFGKNGLCSSCEFYKKNKIQLSEKYKMNVLKKLFIKFPREKGSFFDCIICTDQRGRLPNDKHPRHLRLRHHLIFSNIRWIKAVPNAALAVFNNLVIWIERMTIIEHCSSMITG